MGMLLKRFDYHFEMPRDKSRAANSGKAEERIQQLLQQAEIHDRTIRAIVIEAEAIAKALRSFAEYADSQKNRNAEVDARIERLQKSGSAIDARIEGLQKGASALLAAANAREWQISKAVDSIEATEKRWESYLDVLHKTIREWTEGILNPPAPKPAPVPPKPLPQVAPKRPTPKAKRKARA
jgi:chromosome segregation ATPase